MSVFKSLKGTFQNVQQDIVDGFRALTSLDSSPRHDKVKQLRAGGINLDCGADLLYRYQKDWADLQNYTANSAKKAEEVDSTVADMFTGYTAQWEAVCRLEEEVTALPTFASAVSNMINLIDSLQTDFQRVEDELDQLQNLCEEETMQQERESHLKQLVSYKKAKNAEAFSVKAKLWNSLKDRSKEVETKRSHAMQERQEAFQEAFTSDMDYYRKHGRTDKLPCVTDFPKVSSLSEISIEEDKKELDDFLSSTEAEPQAEGMFIEDDYTADYSAAAEEPHSDFPELDDSRPIDFDDGAASQGKEADPAAQNSVAEESLKGETSDVKQEEEGGSEAASPTEAEATSGSSDMPHEKKKLNGEAACELTKSEEEQEAVVSAADT